MAAPLPLPQLLDEWLRWAEWTTSEPRDEARAAELIGWHQFDWAVQDYPELAWQAIVTALQQPRMDAHVGLLAAGPLEDLLSRHGPAFIYRVEARARVDSKFAWVLGGVWHTQCLSQSGCECKPSGIGADGTATLSGPDPHLDARNGVSPGSSPMTTDAVRALRSVRQNVVERAGVRHGGTHTGHAR